MVQRLIPGHGFIHETGIGHRLLPGAAMVAEALAAPSTPELIGVATTTTFTASGNVPRPAVNPGDLMVMFANCSNADSTITPPAGWTSFIATDTGSVFAMESRAFWKVAAETEPATYNVTVTGNGGGNNFGKCVIASWRGVNATTPIQTSASGSVSSSTSFVCPTVTTTAANSMLVCFYTGGPSTTFTHPSGMQELVDYAGGASAAIGVSQELVATSGATGTRTATASSAVSGHTYSFVLNPAVVPSGAVLEANVSGLSTAAAALTTSINLAGTTAGLSSSTAALSTQIVVAGNAAGVASVTAGLTVPKPLEAASSGQASATANLTIRPAFATLSDNFDDDSRDTAKWLQGNPGGAATTGVVVQETGGKLAITGGVNTVGYSGYTSVDKFSLIGSAAAVRMSIAGSYTNQRALYTVHTSPSTYIGWILIGTSLRVAKSSGGTTYPFIATYNANTHAWLRIREASGTIYFDTAPDTADNPPQEGQWVNRWSEANPFALTELTIGLVAGNDTTSVPSPATTYYDGFNTAATVGAAFASVAASVASSSANLLVPKPVAGTAEGQAAATADITTQVLLAGIADGQAAATADLSTQITLAGSGSGQATFNGALTTEIKLASSVSGQANAAGDLLVPKPVAGTASGQASAGAGLTTEIKLAASSSCHASVTASMTTGAGSYEASASALASAQAALSTQIKLVGTGGVTASATANLSLAAEFTGTATGSATVSGALTTAVHLAASIDAQAAVQGALTTQIRLSASTASLSESSASLTTGAGFQTGVSSVVSASGTLTGVAAAFAGAATASASASAAVQTAIRLVGLIEAVSLAQANLTGGIFVRPTVRTMVVAAEDRVLRVGPEDRTLVIAPEDRTLRIE